MASLKPFPQAGFLSYLELLSTAFPSHVDTSLPPLLVRLVIDGDGSGLSKAGAQLMELLQAQKAVMQAAFDTELANDELRRYQKFAKPGAPSPHIVQLRQKQAAARQASNRAKQSYMKAAAAFVREAGIDVPQRVALDDYMAVWIESHVPKAFVAVS